MEGNARKAPPKRAPTVMLRIPATIETAAPSANRTRYSFGRIWRSFAGCAPGSTDDGSVSVRTNEHRPVEPEIHCGPAEPGGHRTPQRPDAGYRNGRKYAAHCHGDAAYHHADAGLP